MHAITRREHLYMILSRGTPGVGKALRQASRAADRLTAADPGAALRRRVDALHSFVANAGRDEAFRYRSEVSAVLRQVAEGDPEAAVYLLADLTHRAPAGLEPGVDLTVLRAWVHSAGPGAGPAWDALASAPHMIPGRLVRALEGTTGGRLSPAFRATAVERVVGQLDRQACGDLPDEGDLIRLLTIVAPDNAPTEPADWLCVLGDLAAARGEHEEAEARHRAAVRMGSGPARRRVAYLDARRGSTFLSEGDLRAALSRFEAAVELEPDPEYRALLSLTRLLVEPGGERQELPEELRDFWGGVAAVGAGNHDEARVSLRRAGGGEWAEPAAVFLAALDGDDAALTDYGRELYERYGTGWTGRSVVGADVLVVAAARTDFTVLAGLTITEWPGSVVGRLKALVDKAISADARAYASLMKAGERQPWTEAARRIWVATGRDSEWWHHHLAVVHHSAAFDLEAAGSPNAFVHWKAALGLWARVGRDERFWVRMHRQLEDAMGIPVSREVVDAVRRHLYRDLLAPQVMLAGRYRLADPGRAGEHVKVIMSSGFPEEVVAAVRKELIGGVIAALPEAVATGRHGEAIEALGTWLVVDPSNVDLLRAVLWVNRKGLESLRIESHERIGRQLERVTAVVAPGLANRPSMKDRALAAEVARYEYWLGVVDVGRAGPGGPDTVMLRAGDAVLHFQRAVELDPGLITDQYYKNVGELWLRAALLVGMSTVDRAGEPGEWRAVARCLQRAMDVGPASAEADALLDKLIAGPGEGADEVRAQLDRLLGSPVAYQPGLPYWVGCAALRVAEGTVEGRLRQAAANRAVHHLGRTLVTEPMILRHKGFPDPRELIRRARAIIVDPEPERPAKGLTGTLGGSPCGTGRWAWRDGRNPYRSTAFQVLALPVTVCGRAAIRAHIAARRQEVREGVALFGVPLTEGEVDEAEQRILEPAARLLEELCTHRPPDGPEEPTEEHRAAIAAELESLAPQGVAVNAAELARLIPAVRVREFEPLWRG